jgi:Zn-dependent metalloprotease
MAYFQSNRDVFKLRDPASELRYAHHTVDRQGSRHEIFQQYYEGVPVWGGQINAHFDESGALYAVNACYPPTPSLPADGWRLDEGAAIARAAGDLVRTHGPLEDFTPDMRALLEYPGPAAERNVWFEPGKNDARWAWRVEIRPNIADLWRYFIDGASGEILEKYNASNTDGPKTATATDLLGMPRTLNTYQVGSTYYLIDGTRRSFDPLSGLPNQPKGALWTMTAGNTDLIRVNQVTSASNTWTDAAAVSAHYNISRVYEYFLDTHNRNAIDGKGGTMISVVHVTNRGRPMENAYWNGKLMAFGDGGQAFKPLARAMDVTGHEMVHGVIGATVNLGYTFQSGALNESLADVFACMIDRDDWRMGEDIVNSSAFPRGALRDLADPHNGGRGAADAGWQPAHMSEYVKLSLAEDNGGVHVNSGIPNRAAFLVAEALGREKTERIYYRVLEARYLNPFSQFMDMRLGAVRAAADLYGAESPEVAAVRNAFTAVGIGTPSSDDVPKPRPPDRAPAEGEQYVAYINAKPGDSSLYVARAVAMGDSDITRMSSTRVYTGSGRPIAVSGDGSLILFIDAGNSLRAIDDDGERVVGAAGRWKSVAVSPDGSTAALTTLEPDARIHILDLARPDQSRALPLYTPTPGQSTQANNVVYADALEFDATGESLIYDCLNRVTKAQGNSIEFWSANLIDVASGVITPVLPMLPEGVSIGNPSFARTTDLNVVFDLIDEISGTFSVMAVDLFTGSMRTLDSGGMVPGVPRYSTRDDRIVFTRASGNALNVYQLPMEKDKLTPAGKAASFMANAQKPLWFVKQVRTTDLPGRGGGFPAEFGMASVADGNLRMRLPHAADITVEVFDARGRLREEIARGRYGAGSHRIEWSPPAEAGIYLVRMTARPEAGPPAILTRKIVR